MRMLTVRTRAAVTVILLVVFVSMATALPADSAKADRKTRQIRDCLDKLNHALVSGDVAVLPSLFANDSELRVGNQRITGVPSIQRVFQKSPQVWSEKTPWHIQNPSVRFLSPQIALVDAEQVRYGSMTLNETEPITLILVNRQGKWQITYLRVAGSQVNSISQPGKQQLGRSAAMSA